MPIPLQFDLINEIIQHGINYDKGEIVDPSTNKTLYDKGVALVTTYIEQLSLAELVYNPQPIFGGRDGLWIGYELTDKGRELATSIDELRIAVAELTGNAKSEVSESVDELRKECEKKEINTNYKIDFLKTLEEISICFDNKCFIATIGLCGKILEICLKEILVRNNVEYDANWMVGKLIHTIKEKVKDEYIDEALLNIVNIINNCRITAVHAKEKIPIPSRDQAIMVIYAMRDVVRRNMSHKNSIN